MTANDSIPEHEPVDPQSDLRMREDGFEHTLPLFGAFVAVALAALLLAVLTVHRRNPEELVHRPNSMRSHAVLEHWLNEGYFHYVGMLNRSEGRNSLYLNSTGGYMVSGFIVEKAYSAMSGHYSYRLLAVHNQFVSMVLSALAGLLCYRLTRRLGLEPVLSFTAGVSVVLVVFTFPDNLDLYWEMSPQAYALLFAFVFCLLEERGIDSPSRSRVLLISQAATMFLMTVMESFVAFGFAVSTAVVLAILRRGEGWKRYVVVVVLPIASALLLYELQVKVAIARFPDVPTTGSTLLWRTGLDGESLYYTDHLGIATKRDVARKNWPQNRDALFRWKWVFLLGSISTLGVLVGYVFRRVPRVAAETLVVLIGAWLIYAAVFSQAVVIHPYLYDTLLFAPLAMALFCIAPSLLESLTKRSGSFLLVVAFAAIWYSFFQLRLYALRWPLPSQLPPQ